MKLEEKKDNSEIVAELEVIHYLVTMRKTISAELHIEDLIAYFRKL